MYHFAVSNFFEGMIAMRTIHYSIRLTLVLIFVSLFYVSITKLFRQAIQLPTVLTLFFITLCTDRIWTLLAWLSPIMGGVDTKEREHLIEYELARSYRYNSPLVVAAIYEKKRTSLHIVAQNIRTTDMVSRSSAGYLLVLMPGINLEQASPALKRLTMLLPIGDIVVADVTMLQAIVKGQGANHSETRNVTPTEIRKIFFQALDVKCANIIKTSDNETNDPVIYSLLEAAAVDGRRY
jgi:hypothetical protein